MLMDASDEGMGEGDFVFLTVELLRVESMKLNAGRAQRYNFEIKSHQTTNQKLRKIYESLMVISVRIPTSEDFVTFVQEASGYQVTQTVVNEIMTNPMIAAFYDCILMYAWCLNKTLSEGGDPSDGRALSRQLWNTTFYGGLTGNIYINANGDREADFTLNDFDPEKGMMKPVATYFGTMQTYQPIEGASIHWPSGNPPPDVPLCGFQDDQCETPDTVAVWVLSGVFIVLLLITISVLSAACVYRRMKLETQLTDLWWKVRWEDVTILECLPSKSLGSVRLRSGDAQPLKSNRSDTASNSNLSTLDVVPVDGCRVGIYRGKKVAVQLLDINRLNMDRETLVQLRQMRDLTHENLVRFVGLCPDAPNVAILAELCHRGCLQDMLQNDSIKIDWVFKCSMLSDIFEGMNFIHGCPLGVHGRLSSSTCVIDGRFVVKLRDYGLPRIYAQLPRNEGPLYNPTSLFWCAPELLRENQPAKRATKKGDVYSFAILLKELFTRTEPYEEVTEERNFEAEEILNRLRRATNPLMRPKLPADSVPPELVQLIERCWAENPEDRPSFAEIKHQVKGITKGVSSKNILDNLLNRMEQYANNLESMVEEKTKSLLEEKEKTDSLLYQLLPKYVAEELKKSRPVLPETFESVTIFFSDIVGFTVIASESTPIQVVDLLNDLYTCFDAIIENHDVYKVETIGDAYMVVSGLPVRNGNQHAREIARMALAIRDAIGQVKIRHMRDRKLQVRIGIHSGPCAAGVVGLKTPRYCLFGDTVNTASRMESNGQAMKIQVSSATEKILSSFGRFRLALRGDIDIKGKGIMRTYWLEGEDPAHLHPFQTS